MERVCDPTIHTGELVIIDGQLAGEKDEERIYGVDPAGIGDRRYI